MDKERAEDETVDLKRTKMKCEDSRRGISGFNISLESVGS
jgi:hypothetical protein